MIRVSDDDLRHWEVKLDCRGVSLSEASSRELAGIVRELLERRVADQLPERCIACAEREARLQDVLTELNFIRSRVLHVIRKAGKPRR